MKGTEIAAVLGGIATIIGVIGGLYGTWRLARGDKVKQGADNAAVLLGGWRDIQNATLKEVERVRTACEEEIAKLKAEHDADRADWDRREAKMLAREAKMQEQIDKLEAQVVTLLEKKARGG